MFKRIFRHPVVIPLALAFLLINLCCVEYGGPNAASRYAALHAMSHDHTFEITPYQGWTIDWAQTPDGKVFSNKAPGPVLVGFPIYWIMEKASNLLGYDQADKQSQEMGPSYWFRVLFIFCLQVFPFILIAGFCADYLNNRAASPNAVLFTMLAIFFGNTAAVFVNSNFGHGFSAILELGILLSLLSRRYMLAGFMAGLAVLSDYGMIMQIPGLVLGLWLLLRDKKRRIIGNALSHFCLGAIPGAVLWCWYHIACFGSIFSLPNKYQNPRFVDPNPVSWNLWGVLSIPSPQAIYQLLLGGSRGILFTQSWVLVIFIFALLMMIGKARRIHEVPDEHKNQNLVIWIYGFVGLLGLLIMNAGFNRWDGGATPGPRYLCAVFPAIALAAGVIYDSLVRWQRIILWFSLTASVVFRGLVYSDTILLPNRPLWPYLLNNLFDAQTSPRALASAAIYLVLLLIAVVWSIDRCRSAKINP